MNCAQCGALALHDAKFCTSCGCRVVSAARSSKACVKCLSDVQAGANFCKKCGTPVERQADMPVHAIPIGNVPAAVCETGVPSAVASPASTTSRQASGRSLRPVTAVILVCMTGTVAYWTGLPGELAEDNAAERRASPAASPAPNVPGAERPVAKMPEPVSTPVALSSDRVEVKQTDTPQQPETEPRRLLDAKPIAPAAPAEQALTIQRSVR